MDKYLLVILMFLIAGMGIGITREPPQYGLFYSMLVGAIIVILYSSFKSRKEHKKINRNKRTKKRD